jgi:large subunit ribosomal protein L13
MFDARNQPVGWLANRIAFLLQGKYKPNSFHNWDNGDGVIVVNSDHVHLGNRKWQEKMYRKHSGYPGGLNEVPAWMMREKYSNRIIELAVRGMLPKNRLRDARLSRLRVFTGPEHDFVNLFPEHASVDWPTEMTQKEIEAEEADLDDIGCDDVTGMFEDGWIYDTKEMIRYREDDNGTFVEEPILINGKKVEQVPHKYPTAGY